jgi:hypothetical protein
LRKVRENSALLLEKRERSWWQSPAPAADRTDSDKSAWTFSSYVTNPFDIDELLALVSTRR